MDLHDTVRLSDGRLALRARSTEAERAVRGTVRGVDYSQSWDVWTLDRVKVVTESDPAGSWWPAPMWEVTE